MKVEPQCAAKRRAKLGPHYTSAAETIIRFITCIRIPDTPTHRPSLAFDPLRSGPRARRHYVIAAISCSALLPYNPVQCN